MFNSFELSQAWDREKSEYFRGVEPMTSATLAGCSTTDLYKGTCTFNMNHLCLQVGFRFYLNLYFISAPRWHNCMNLTGTSYICQIK